MLDQSTAYAYEPDTEVTDEPPPIAIGRVSTADLTMQIKVAGIGGWHRRTPDLSETACGVPFHSQFGVPRREQLTMADGGLCDQCHTEHEMRRAAENDERTRLAAEEADRKRRLAAEQSSIEDAEALERFRNRSKRNTGER